MKIIICLCFYAYTLLRIDEDLFYKDSAAIAEPSCVIEYHKEIKYV